ncbi:hypothetical protein [Syntrophus aciditrophicus]|jgi:hypothetical protein|nr:hypothetical protein [Syntrophus aciditrophicus]
MTVIEAVQTAGIVYVILAIIGFGVAGMIKAMSIFFKSGQK